MMRAKCNKCGFVTRFPYYLKHKFRYCYRCGGSFEIFYTNKKEEYIVKEKNKSITLQKDKKWESISKILKK